MCAPKLYCLWLAVLMVRSEPGALRSDSALPLLASDSASTPISLELSAFLTQNSSVHFIWVIVTFIRKAPKVSGRSDNDQRPRRSQPAFLRAGGQPRTREGRGLNRGAEMVKQGGIEACALGCWVGQKHAAFPQTARRLQPSHEGKLWECVQQGIHLLHAHEHSWSRCVFSLSPSLPPPPST